MARTSDQLSRTQLVSIIASLRGELESLVAGSKWESGHLALEVEDFENAETLLHFTAFEPSQIDLVDGHFDSSWHSSS